MRAIIILLALIAVAHAEALPKKKVGTCPAGYSQSGGFCNPIWSDAPAAIPKGAGAVPERVDLGRRARPSHSIQAEPRQAGPPAAGFGHSPPRRVIAPPTNVVRYVADR